MGQFQDQDQFVVSEEVDSTILMKEVITDSQVLKSPMLLVGYSWILPMNQEKADFEAYFLLRKVILWMIRPSST